MRWRFADLPIRTKFMITLGIPVVGMVLLIGKQVDSSIKRLEVMDYVNEQSALIGRFAEVIHDLQRESALSVGFLTGKPVTPIKLSVQQQRTNASIEALRDPTHPNDPKVVGGLPFDGLNILRSRVAENRIDAVAAGRSFGEMDQRLLDEMAAAMNRMVEQIHGVL